MASKRQRKPEDFQDIPSPTGDPEAGERWNAFMFKLGELSDRVDALTELGETIILGLKEAADTGEPIVSVLDKIATAFQGVREEYRKARGG